MKKIMFLALLAFASSCQKSEIEKKQVDYSGITASLEAMYNGAFAVALKSKPENVYSSTYKYLNQNYFTGDFKLSPIELKTLTNARISSARELDLSFLSDEQRTLTIPFLDKIINSAELSVANDLANKFNNDITSSSLTEVEKYQLLSIGSAIKVGVKVIEDATSKVNSGGRTEKIDVKGALRAGVLGLAGGAISGCVTGALGGTVALPLFGTAGGCVGGAVFGGAYGFVVGVGGSILQDLIFG
jgi:hypothetical protein